MTAKQVKYNPNRGGETIESMWLCYREYVYAEIDEKSNAYFAMKQSFYSGIYTFMATMARVSEKLPELDAIHWLENRKTEIEKDAENSMKRYGLDS